MNCGLINSITRLHLVGYFYWIILRCTDPWLLNAHCTLTEGFLNLTEVFLILTEVFPCFFLSCKANARVKLAKTGHGPHSFTLFCICVVRLLFVLFYILFVCKCVLPPGDNPIAVNKYIISLTRDRAIVLAFIVLLKVLDNGPRMDDWYREILQSKYTLQWHKKGTEAIRIRTLKGQCTGYLHTKYTLQWHTKGTEAIRIRTLKGQCTGYLHTNSQIHNVYIVWPSCCSCSLSLTC